MGPVTALRNAAARGEAGAAQELLPLVYGELRRLAASRLAGETPGQTLQPTALVHEAYLRLVGDAKSPAVWDHKGHFFAAAAEAMRRILVERARQRKSDKRGGGRRRLTLEHYIFAADEAPDDLLDLDEALTRLAYEDAAAAEVVRLRLFAGLSVEEAADALGQSRATAYRHWTYARAWLGCAMKK